MSSTVPSIVLIIAGNDPSGGAGLTADTQAITALGAHPAPVITALTVQDTVNAYHAEAIAAKLVAAQPETVLQNMPAAAIKPGLRAAPDAAAQAQDYTWNALRRGWQLGRGQKIPNRGSAA